MAEKLTQEILAALRVPFSAGNIKIKMQTQPKEGETGKALCVAYIDSRDVMQRLDDVIGGEWSDSYSAGINGGVECKLTIMGITRADVGTADENEKEKSAYSDAFKRAGVKFGIGRFLYDLPKMWAECTKSGKYWNMNRGEMERMQSSIQSYLNKTTVARYEPATVPAPANPDLEYDFPESDPLPITIEAAKALVGSDGIPYDKHMTQDLVKISRNAKAPAARRQAAAMIIASRNASEAVNG